MEKTKLILDCDPGIDDAFAIPVAARYGDLVGITTVGGNASLRSVTQNALLVTQLFGIDVEVHSGLGEPLVGEAKLALEIHGDSGFGSDALPAVEREVTSDSAVDFIVESARTIEGLWLVAIGPLTNVASALVAAPEICDSLAGISFMGGSACGGNFSAAAEFNAAADPEALQIVLASGVPLRMAGLDLTQQFPISDDWATEVAEIGSVGAALLANLTSFVLDRMKSFGLGRVAHLHDPVAVLSVTHPGLVDGLVRDVSVEVDGAHTRGMTVVDTRIPGGNPAGNVWHGHTLDGVEARRLVMEALVV